MIREPWKVTIKRHAVNWFAASVGRLTSAPGHLRILTFHNIAGDADDLYAVAEARFADFLSLLQDEGYATIRARDLAADWPAVVRRDRLVLLTFDDGYTAQKDVAAELLARRSMTATFFVVSSFVERARSHRDYAGRESTFFSGEDLRQLALGGFEIGSHSHTHPMLGLMPVERVDAEMQISRQILQEAVSSDIVSFAYPFGQRGAFSPVTRTMLEKNGYCTAFTQKEMRITAESDLLSLPRTNVGRFDTVATFRRKLHGCYDVAARLRRFYDPT
jgi:peptidoglycan/xylan/chitin deacetylase (PgdA/CDA1 family)